MQYITCAVAPKNLRPLDTIYTYMFLLCIYTHTVKRQLCTIYCSGTYENNILLNFKVFVIHGNRTAQIHTTASEAGDGYERTH